MMGPVTRHALAWQEGGYKCSRPPCGRHTVTQSHDVSENQGTRPQQGGRTGQQPGLVERGLCVLQMAPRSPDVVQRGHVGGRVAHEGGWEQAWQVPLGGDAVSEVFLRARGRVCCELLALACVAVSCTLFVTCWYRVLGSGGRWAEGHAVRHAHGPEQILPWVARRVPRLLLPRTSASPASSTPPPVRASVFFSTKVRKSSETDLSGFRSRTVWHFSAGYRGGTLSSTRQHPARVPTRPLSCACSARSCLMLRTSHMRRRSRSGQRCAAGTSTATDAVGCGLLHNVRKDQGYSIYVHVRWVLSGKYCSTGSVLGVIRLPRLPVRNCIKAQNEKKHWYEPHTTRHSAGSSAPSGAAGTNAGLFSPLVQVRRKRIQPWPHVTALLRRPQPRAAVAAWPSSALRCRSTPAPAPLFLGGGASRWRPGSRGRLVASPLCSPHARLTLAGFLSLSNTTPHDPARAQPRCGLKPRARSSSPCMLPHKSARAPPCMPPMLHHRCLTRWLRLVRVRLRPLLLRRFHALHQNRHQLGVLRAVRLASQRQQHGAREAAVRDHEDNALGRKGPQVVQEGRRALGLRGGGGGEGAARARARMRTRCGVPRLALRP